jgi:P4 family phage/plasmid primase-like protien
VSTLTPEELKALQKRAAEVAAHRVTYEAKGARGTTSYLPVGVTEFTALTEEQCYDLIGDHEITLEQQSVHAKPPDQAPVGKLAKAQHLCTDLANANRLKQVFGKRIVSIGGEFFVWSGKYWARAVNGEAHQYAGNLSQMVGREAKAARDKADTAQGEWAGTTSAEHRALAALHPRKHPLPEMPDPVVRLCASAAALEAWVKECEMKYRKDAAVVWLREAHTLDPSVLDRDPWLFNCENGTIDVRTGELRAHNPNDYITVCAPVSYNPDAKAPLFESFVNEIVEGGEPVSKFLQRVYGSALTGIVREHHLLVRCGSGRNGKGALNRTTEHVLGEYACTTPRHLVADSGRGSERHETEIMTLRGKRLATAHESDKGAVLREGFVKQMTGGDNLTGRFMRKDHVTFKPTHKAQLLTNDKPDVRGQENAIWDRLLLVNFPIRYGSPEQVAAGEAMRPIDVTLEGRMCAEREGILTWLIRGALEWQRNGLRPPEAVRKASREYQNEQDRLGLFITERCVLDPAAKTQITGCPEALFISYRGWCSENNFIPLGSGKFKKELVRRPGIQEDTWSEGKKGAGRRTMRGLSGIRLKSELFEEIEESEVSAGKTAESVVTEPAPASQPETNKAPAAEREDAPASPAAPATNGAAHGKDDEALRKMFEKELPCNAKVADGLVRAFFSSHKAVAETTPDVLHKAIPGLKAEHIPLLQERALKAHNKRTQGDAP